MLICAIRFSNQKKTLMAISIQDLQAIATKGDMQEIFQALQQMRRDFLILKTEVKSLLGKRDKRGPVITQQFYSASQFAKIIGRSKSTVLRWCGEGRIRHTQGSYGGAVLIPATEIDRIHAEISQACD